MRRVRFEVTFCALDYLLRHNRSAYQACSGAVRRRNERTALGLRFRS